MRLPRAILAGGPGTRTDPQQVECPIVAPTPIILREQAFEHRARGRHAREQRGARLELQVVGGAEDLPRGPAREADDRLGALAKPRPEDRVIEVGPRLVEALDRVASGGRAGTQAVDLREDVPHPVRALPA